MRNLFLLHLREQRRLTPLQIEERTGIPAAQYLEYENTPTFMPTEYIELLSVLLRVKAEYLESYCHQLHLFAHHKGMLEIQEERIQNLTRALKRRIRNTPPGGKKQSASGNRSPAKRKKKEE